MWALYGPTWGNIWALYRPQDVYGPYRDLGVTYGPYRDQYGPCMDLPERTYEPYRDLGMCMGPIVTRGTQRTYGDCKARIGPIGTMVNIWNL